MKIIIIGAGELGCLMARRLCKRENDVTVIDTDNEKLSLLHEKLELRIVEGAAADPEVLKSAGASSADVLLALSGDEAVNAIACRIASKLGTKRTICRLYSGGFLSGEDGITPDLFGIDRAFSPPEECTRKILDVLTHQEVIETIRFTHPDARMSVLAISPSSVLAGVRLKDLSSVEVVQFVRIAAIVREKEFLLPHGDTIIVPGDKLYVGGRADHVEAFILWAENGEDSAIRRVVLSGATDIGLRLARSFEKNKIEFRVLEPDPVKAERFLDQMPQGSIVVRGSPTDEDAMNEIGAGTCDAFISVSDSDENGILSCLLAKKYGAGKAIAVTHKTEYIGIVPSLTEIDCAFNSTLVSLNTVFRLMETGSLRVDSQLHRFHAHFAEMVITEHSPLAGRTVRESGLPRSCVLSLILRGNEVVAPAGNTLLQAGDTAVMIVTPETEKELRPFFPQGRILS